MIFVNDLVDIVENQTKLFEDDTKVLAPIKTPAGVLSLQKDIDSIV
jgi:hypothetical protein